MAVDLFVAHTLKRVKAAGDGLLKGVQTAKPPWLSSQVQSRVVFAYL